MNANGSAACPSFTSALTSLKRGCLASPHSWNSAISLVLNNTPGGRGQGKGGGCHASLI